MNSRIKFGMLALGVISSALASAQDNIQVIVNGTPVVFRNQQPVMSGDRVLIPLRGVLQEMGAIVDWNPEGQVVTAHKGHTTVRLQIDQKTASVDGQPVQMDVPAQILNNSTLVPLRFVSESLGADVHWNSNNYTVMINSTNPGGVGQGISADENRRQRAIESREQRLLNLEKGSTTVFQSGIVFPVTIDDTLSSATSRRGDRFSATLNSNQAGLPAGTHIDGYVYGVTPFNGNQPGMIEVRFDKAVLPDGAGYALHGYLTRLGSGYVKQEGGRFVAIPGSANNRVVFAGYGPNGQTMVGISEGRQLAGVSINNFYGFDIDVNTGRVPHEVSIPAGAHFGVRLVQNMTVRQGDLHS